MAEKKKYNSILVSGRKDETLTYSKYIKDEESGESVKESLDKKVNVTDKLETQQIKDGAITNEKMAAGSVGNTNLQDGSVSNEKLEDGSITNEKLAEDSITKDKLKDNTIGVEKLDQELRQTINAATGLPENLVETIQNVDDTLKDHQRQIDDKQSQIDNKQQQITANDEDISLLQTRSNQMEETIKSIAATGGASQATAVTYNNEKSKLTAVNIQSAVDEVVDKSSIKDEEGTIVETPFRYIQNEEFIFAKLDAEDKLLFGIQWDGTPVFSKTSAVEDRLQLQVNLLADKVTSILGDGDTTSAIDTLKELKDFFANIDNTQTLTSILANLNSISTKLGEDIKNLQDTKVDKEEGKSLIEDEVKECFRVIENEEFIHAVIDSESRLLFGIYRYSGKPYFPLNEMYHVIQNEEYFAAWVTTDDKIVLGIRRDGEIIGEIHAVNALKQVISQLQSDLASLQEKVDTIDVYLKDFLDVFSLQENLEYLAVEKDAEGKILASTNADGSHYIHNAKSETIPTEFEHIEDPEGRTEITTDAEDKVMSYRDDDGKKHEHDMEITNLDVSNLNLQGNSVNNIQDALKANGFDVKTHMDWSEKSELQIPEPLCAFVNIKGILPTSKGNTTKGEIQFYDMQGNYFRKFIEMDIHGRTSALYKKKNYTFDFFNDAEHLDAFTIKFGDWVSMDSYYFQGWYSDAFRGIDIIEYKLYQQIISTRGCLKDKPYKYHILKNLSSSGNEDSKELENNFEKNALCTPMGFPVVMYLNDEFWGIYTIMLKKNRANFRMNKKDYNAVMLDLDNGDIVNGIKNWESFEIRNPKTLICMDGTKYDGDNPKELIDESSEKYSSSNKDMVNTVKTKNAIISLADSYNLVKEAVTNKKSNDEVKALIEKYYNVDYVIDYLIFSNVIQNTDGWGGNWQWTTWDGIKWNPNPYDLNASLGIDAFGMTAHSPNQGLYKSAITSYVYDYYIDEIKSRYKYLRDSNIISIENIMNIFESWIKRIGTDNYAKEFKKWNSTPSQRDSNINSTYWELSSGPMLPGTYPIYSDSTSYSNGQIVRNGEKFYKSLIDNNIGNMLSDTEKWKAMYYDENINFVEGDEVICTSTVIVKFKCIKSCIGQPPVYKTYDEAFGILGYYDSIARIYKWFEESIAYLDSIWMI